MQNSKKVDEIYGSFEEWVHSHEWLKFRNADKPAESLGRKLIKEQQKRKAAEKEVARWKKKYLETKEELEKEI